MFYSITKLDSHKPHSARPNDSLLEQFKEQLNDISIIVASGSYFTQLIDSVVNYVTSIYVQLKVFGKWYPTYVLGDR